jgi:tripartite-type tricarboxylate transporter receptor subunit TctC
MKLPRRKFLGLAAGATVLPIAPRLARALAYPTRPVRIIATSAPGGAQDILARLMAQWLSDRLGQPFVVENRPGGAGNIGTEVVVRAPADGYTLLLVSAPNIMNASLYERLNYNFLRDVVPIAGVIRVPTVMVVHPSVPARTVPEFISYAKANPGKVNMGSAGNGTMVHVAGELFKIMTGLDVVHVPYRGGGPALADLLGGQFQVMFPTSTSSIGYIKAGRLPALAVTSASRSAILPDLPTISEFVPGYEASAIFGIGAPKEVPAEVVKLLNREINAGLLDPKLMSKLAALGGEGSFALSPAQFRKLLVDETERWGKVIRAANIKAF